MNGREMWHRKTWYDLFSARLTASEKDLEATPQREAEKWGKRCQHLGNMFCTSSVKQQQRNKPFLLESFQFRFTKLPVCLDGTRECNSGTWHSGSFLNMIITLGMGKPWPTSHIQPVRLFNPAHQTLLQIIVKTDFILLISCSTGCFH